MKLLMPAQAILGLGNLSPRFISYLDVLNFAVMYGNVFQAQAFNLLAVSHLPVEFVIEDHNARLYFFN